MSRDRGQTCGGSSESWSSIGLALAAVLCCGLPVLLAAGGTGTVTGLLGRALGLGWPLALLIAAAVTTTAYIAYRRALNRRSTNMKHKLKITGMHCTDCAVTVQKALTSAEGVQSASVSYLKKEAIVEVPVGLEIGGLLKAVEQAGYKAEPAGTER